MYELHRGTVMLALNFTICIYGKVMGFCFSIRSIGYSAWVGDLMVVKLVTCPNTTCSVYRRISPKTSKSLSKNKVYGHVDYITRCGGPP